MFFHFQEDTSLVLPRFYFSAYIAESIHNLSIDGYCIFAYILPLILWKKFCQLYFWKQHKFSPLF